MNFRNFFPARKIAFLGIHFVEAPLEVIVLWIPMENWRLGLLIFMEERLKVFLKNISRELFELILFL